MAGVHCTLPLFGFPAGPALAMPLEAIARQSSPLSKGNFWSGGALPALTRGQLLEGACFPAAIAPFLGAPIHNNCTLSERGWSRGRLFAFRVEGSTERPRREVRKHPVRDHRQGSWRPGPDGPEGKGYTPLNPQQRAVVTTLLKNLRAWPVDADWDQVLESAGLLGELVDEDVLQQVARILPKFKSKSVPQSGSDNLASPDNPGGETESEEEEGEGKMWYPVFYPADDALRMLGLYRWRQRRHPKRFSERLALQLLMCLSNARLSEEVASFQESLKASVSEHSKSLDTSTLTNLYFRIGEYENAIRVYNEARAKGALVEARCSVTTLLSMAAAGYPGEQLFEVFKAERDKLAFRHKSFIAMLTRGVPLEDIKAAIGDRKSVVEGLIGRLITALSELGRRDEACAQVRPFLEPGGPLLTISILVSVLTAMENSGLIEEAQQLMDHHVAGGVDMGRALNYRMARLDKNSSAVRVYRSLMRLEGSHRSSFSTHVMALGKFANMGDADGVWEVYNTAKESATGGKGFKPKKIFLNVYVDVIRTLAKKGREFEAEQVLADCLQAHHESMLPTERLQLESAYVSLARMYLAQRNPQKVVDLARLMVLVQHWVSGPTLKNWASAMRAQGAAAEAEQLEAEGARMDEYRPQPAAVWIRREAGIAVQGSS